MAYYKNADEDYIYSIGTAAIGEEITEEEYNAILSALKNCPNREGYGYTLKTDLTWESYHVEPCPEPDPDPEEALSILLGGVEV